MDPSSSTATSGSAPPTGRPRAGTARLLENVPLLLLAVVGIVVNCLRIHRTHFNPDELEHLHAAWLWWRGLLPYRDFFEHHPPALWLLLRPVVAHFSPDDLVGAVLAGRWIMLGVLLLTALVTWSMARCWTGSARAGRIAAVGWLLSSSLTGHPIYIRPDQPMLLCLLLGTQASLASAGLAGPTRRHGAWKIPLGLLGGISFVVAAAFQTKAVFWVLPFLAGMLAAGLLPAGRKVLVPLLSVLVGAATAASALLLFMSGTMGSDALWQSQLGTNQQIVGLALSGGQSIGTMLAQPFSYALPWAPFAAAGLLLLTPGLLKKREYLRLATILGCLGGSLLLVVVAPTSRVNYFFPLWWMMLLSQAFSLAWLCRKWSPWAASAVAGVYLLRFLVGLMGNPPLSPLGGGLPLLERGLQPLQAALDRAEPGDRILALEHVQPVFIMDADPMLWMVRLDGSSHEYDQEFTGTLQRLQPRFITRSSVRPLHGADEILERDYNIMNKWLMERKPGQGSP